MILNEIGQQGRCTISQLARRATITRQAVTKHLRVLERASLVRGARRGRERLFEISIEPLRRAQRALERLSSQWDVALARLKTLVEQD